MDKTDKEILRILQKNSRITNQELAEKVNLSPSPCLRRVKQLEKLGYIKQYISILDPKKLGFDLTIFILIGLNTHDPKKMEKFQETVIDLPNVLECHLITGQSADYLLKVVTNNLENYHQFLLKKLSTIPGVNNIHSSFVLNTVTEKLIPLSRYG